MDFGKTIMPRTILIADDEPSMQKLYVRMFSGTEYVITLAASVGEARNFIEANHYDLLITDLMFPDGLGTELVKLFQKKRTGAKSLLVTGFRPPEIELRGAGICECFDKPLKLEPFMSAVRNALGAED